MNAALNIFARVRVTSPAPREAPVMVPAESPADYSRDMLRASLLADRLTWCLARVEQAALRAKEEDTPRAYQWLMSWCVLGRVLETEWRVAIGELPAADGSPT